MSSKTNYLLHIDQHLHIKPLSAIEDGSTFKLLVIDQSGDLSVGDSIYYKTHRTDHQNIIVCNLSSNYWQNDLESNTAVIDLGDNYSVEFGGLYCPKCMLQSNYVEGILIQSNENDEIIKCDKCGFEPLWMVGV